MSECTRLSDRMVPVAHGWAAWGPAEREHLERCSHCASEWALVQVGARLGMEIEASLPADFMATRVLAGLRRRDTRVSAWGRAARWLALPFAAAAALMLWRGTGAPEMVGSVPFAAAEVLLPELEDLEPDELEALLEAVPASGIPVGGGGGLGDLDEQELQAMLRSMEG